ncbi:MAG: replication-associated recombination protein A [Chlamydiia bacterium]|nr:replication-associated recombination protein A [Chlamydiia bacterium]
MKNFASIPLSEQLRPTTFSEIVGQEHLTGKDGYITRIVASGRPLSLLLSGPPGCGKTTIARLYAAAFHAPFLILSAVFNSAAELKKILKEGQETPLFSRRAIVFIDEIHRFNRAQQDLFLPFLEDGSLILIGATTENPSFALNGALISRLRILTLNHLNDASLHLLLQRYETLVRPLPLDLECRSYLVSASQGDGRHLLNLLETLEQDLPESINIALLAQRVHKRPPLYDKDRDGHYNLISALHKAVRGSDPDASLYWFARILEGGEDPLFIARRLIRMASEDIGLADPHALGITLQAHDAYQRLGSPEGELALAEAVLYLALAPKSNAVYTAYTEARETASASGHLSPPKQILNAPTPLMKEMGYGQGYVYDPDTSRGFSGQEYFPEELGRKSFYSPVERGFEREMKKRLEYFSALRRTLASNHSHPL